MPAHAHKQDVRCAFDNAASTYDGAAHFQRLICDRLVGRLREAAPALAPAHVLDAGCGTGHGARELARLWPQAQVIGLDFARGMLAIARRTESPHHAVCADLEQLPLHTACIDVWFSSLALQWCDPQCAFDEARRVLRPGGLLVTATLGPETLFELRQAFDGIDRHTHVQPLSAGARIAETLQSAGFEILVASSEPVVLFRPDVRTIMQNLREIGAATVAARRHGMLGRRAWQTIVERYEARRTPAGLPVTYDALYLIAAKATA